MIHVPFFFFVTGPIRFVALRGGEVVAEADTHGELVRTLAERNLDGADLVFAARQAVPEKTEHEGSKRGAGV